MPGRRRFLRRRHVAAADAGTGHYRGVIAIRRAYSARRARCRRGAWASWLRSGSRPLAGDPGAGGIERWPSARSGAFAMRAAAAPATALSGQRRALARRGSGRSGPRPSPGPPAARLGRACPCPAAARRRRELADEITTPSAEFAGPATGADQDMRLCGGYSGYSEDTTADNVSSPMPRASGGYSEDTQNGAGDNGGTARVLPDLPHHST